MSNRIRYGLATVVATLGPAAASIYLIIAFTPVPVWAILVASAVMTWAVLEACAWTIIHRREDIREGSRLIFEAARDPQGRSISPLRFHPFVNFLPTPSLTMSGINPGGFQSAGPTEGFQGTRVYLSGDCTLVDRVLPLEETIGYLLQEKLRDLAPPEIEVVNGGFSHYTSLHSLNRLVIDVQRFSFDVGIMATGINDVLAFAHTAGAPEPDYSNFYRVPQGVSHARERLPGRHPWLFSRLPTLQLYSYWILMNLLPRHQIGRVVSIDESYTTAENIEKCYSGFHTRFLKQNLRAFIALCRLHQACPVLTTIIYNRDEMTAPVRAFYAYGIDLANEEIRRTASEEEALLLDMANGFPEGPGLIDDKWGFTAQGNAERVSMIKDFLQRNNLLNMGHSPRATSIARN